MSRNPHKCTMKGCKGIYEQSKTNPDYFVCSVCGVGIWRDYKPPNISRSNVIESEGAIQYRYGLNTRYTGGRVKNKGSSSSGKSRRRKKPDKRQIPEILQV